MTLLENTTIVDSTASAISLNDLGAVIRKSIVNGFLAVPVYGLAAINYETFR
jgi:hypothetical protein